MEHKNKSTTTFHQNIIDKDDGSSDKWLITFADLLSLIITFFVLIYSMTVMNSDKWKMVTTSLSQELNPDKEVKKTLPSVDKSITKVVIGYAKSLEYLNVVLLDKISESKILKDMMKINLSNGKLTINIRSDLIFKKGDVVMDRKGEYIFEVIINILKSLSNRINIYGYAYEEPKDIQKYPSKWELSLTRALVISKILRNKGYKYNILSYGLADKLGNNGDEVIKKEGEKSVQRVDVVIRKEEIEY